MRGVGGVLIPKSVGLKKKRNPEVPKFEKDIPGSRKGQSRNPELKNTRSWSPDKGPTPLINSDCLHDKL